LDHQVVESSLGIIPRFALGGQQMSGAASTFGSELKTNDRVHFRLYCSVFVIVFLGWLAVGRADAQTLPPDDAAAAPAATDTSPLSDTMAPIIRAASDPPGNVTTYHYDTSRTGWNPSETTLTPGPSGNVKPGSFGVLQSVRLPDATNDFVDAQPLVVTGLTLNGTTQDVVYVATEANNIYAISASGPKLGKILVQRNLGTPVGRPLNCGNNGPVVGINSTPVIHLDPTDLTSGGTMYVMSYELVNTPTYKLHALNLKTLEDKIAPAMVTASHTLTNNTTYSFNATVSRQRAALLEANGNIYAAFASYCDLSASKSRGWLLGWDENTLAPLAANQLNNRLSTSRHSFFLTSIWMSGYGLAAGPSGVLYFVTGNSDYSGTTYSPPNNIQESVVKLSADLTTLLDYFTPTGSDGVGPLDVRDEDFGSGGAMVVPDVSGQAAFTLVAAGKAGHLYLINRSNMRHNTGRVLASVSIGGCWCGPSYFVGSDGVRRIVSSGGRHIGLWKAPASSATLQPERSFNISSGQDPGFFTTVSSNNQAPGTAIIWAVNRPANSNPARVTLYAFDPTAATGNPVYTSDAGSWPIANGNANIVPVVSNGKVFVASFAALNIFGPGGTAAPLVVPPPPPPRAPLPSQIFGKIIRIDTPQITIQPATGALVTVDTTDAVAADLSVPLVVGRAVHVFGPRDVTGVWHAQTIERAKDDPALWQPFP
jgi:hypothetical protein